AIESPPLGGDYLARDETAESAPHPQGPWFRLAPQRGQRPQQPSPQSARVGSARIVSSYTSGVTSTSSPAYVLRSSSSTASCPPPPTAATRGVSTNANRRSSGNGYSSRQRAQVPTTSPVTAPLKNRSS